MLPSVAPALVLLLVLCALDGCATPLYAAIIGGGESKLRVAVDLAETEDARRQGLRSYSSLSPDQGLALVFPGPSEVCITNEGVSFAIDAVFVEAGQVTAVESFAAGVSARRCGARGGRRRRVAGGGRRPAHL